MTENAIMKALASTERDLIESIVTDMFFADYGYVTEVYPPVGTDKTRVDVKHAVKPKVLGDDLPPTETKGVELLFPSSAAYAEEWDIAKGDGVLLIGLKWYINTVDKEGPQSSDNRLHYTQECMKAIPLGRYSGDAVVHLVIHEGKWKLSATEIDLNGDSKQLVTKAELQTALTALANTLAAHMHPTAATGPPSVSPTLVGLAVDISAAGTTTIKTGG